MVIAAALPLVIKFYKNNEHIKLENWHIYSVIFVLLISSFVILNDDFIEEVVFNTSTKKVEIIYYNVYKKQMKKVWDFEEFFAEIETTYKKDVVKINFYRNRHLGFVLKKKKDNFSQQSINEINDILSELKLVKNK
ncbi:MAG: hypothetical protein KA319_11470 [Ferruginibacter sp.]|nr:hypothetical protein [Ferruginibacter sp.]